MVQIGTPPPKRIALRSVFDIRWLLALSLGILVSVGYYALLIWTGLWLLRAVMGLFGG